MEKAAAFSEKTDGKTGSRVLVGPHKGVVLKNDKYPVDLHRILHYVFVQLFGGRPVATSMERKDTV